MPLSARSSFEIDLLNPIDDSRKGVAEREEEAEAEALEAGGMEEAEAEETEEETEEVQGVFRCVCLRNVTGVANVLPHFVQVVLGVIDDDMGAGYGVSTFVYVLVFIQFLCFM